MSLKKQNQADASDLIEYSNSKGIHKIGWFTPSFLGGESIDFTGYKAAIKERQEYHHIKYRTLQDFLVAGSIDKKYNTVIVILMDYFVSNNYEKGSLKLSNYSRNCWQTTNPKAELIIDFLRERGYTADRINVPDRAAACRAGLGFIGKNCLFYGYGMGSYVGIRTIGTDLVLNSDNEGGERTSRTICRNCGKCIEACPTKAIYKEGYRIDPCRCISFINRHVEEEIKILPGRRDSLDSWLHGCEICQDACPLNAGLRHEVKVSEEEVNLYGMKLKNTGNITINEVKEKIDNIMEPEYVKYVNELINKIELEKKM